MAPRSPKPPDRTSNPRFKGKRGATPKQPNLAALIRELPTAQEMAAIVDEIAHVHDRTAALLIATQMEAFLERAIYTKLPRLNDELAKAMTRKDGPLSGFHSKILLVFALGLIDEKTQASLDTIREIRNAFAHAAKPLRFSTPQIATLCARLGGLHRITPKAPASPQESLAFQMAGIPEDPNRQIMLAAYVVLIPLILDLIFPGFSTRLLPSQQHGIKDAPDGIGS